MGSYATLTVFLDNKDFSFVSLQEVSSHTSSGKPVASATIAGARSIICGPTDENLHAIKVVHELVHLAIYELGNFRIIHTLILSARFSCNFASASRFASSIACIACSSVGPVCTLIFIPAPSPIAP